jgi:hypothetical protein
MIKRYALYDTVWDKYIEFYARSVPDADCSVDVEFSLSAGNDQIWLAKTYEKANYVRTHSTAWYNAGYDTPEHHLDSQHIEVREIIFP